jgi:ABC-2 type transport system ATP-binding protein
MIEVLSLTKYYGSRKAIDSISFTVQDGEVAGLLGLNGAGKSTTMNIMAGCLSASSGKALINGLDIAEEPEKAKLCIGYLPEIPPLYTDMKVFEY